MKRGSEIGIATISTINREGTDDLKDLHYAINDLLYFYNKKYISRKDAEHILSCLQEHGTALSELKVPAKAKDKKEELLNAVRNIWKSVNSYYKSFKWSDSDISQIQATINYQVKQLVDAKSDGRLIKLPIKYLDENKMIYDNMVIDSGYADKLKLDTFKEFNEQIINVVVKKYSFE